MSERGNKLYGLLAEFESAKALVVAARRTRRAGFSATEAYAPFPVHGLPEAIGARSHMVPLIVLIGGIIGAAGGYFLEWYPNVITYPLNIGGRPFNSWPLFIPITFELMVLCAGLTAGIGMIALNRLPKPYHPVFNVPEFERASCDRFFLCVEAKDPQFELAATREFLAGLGATGVFEVPE